MTPDRINSTGQPVIKSEKLVNNIRSGNNYDLVKTGSLSAMKVERMIALAGGASHIELESMADGNYQFTASYPWDVVNGSNSEAPINSHELDESKEQVPWFQSDVVFAKLASAFGSYTGAIGAKSFLIRTVDWYNTQSTPEMTHASMEAGINATYTGGQLALMLNLFRGVAYHKETTCDQTIVDYKRRITAANFNQIQASFVGAGQIWTTAEVISFEQTPAEWWFQLPSSLLWFKSNPRVLTVAGQKTELIFSYKSCVTAWDGKNTAYASASLLSF
jgi:hypothetical protein